MINFRYSLIAIFVTVTVFASVNIKCAQSWEPVTQPDLAQKLAGAQPLEAENLGPAAADVIPWRTDIVPNPDGKTHDVLTWYFEAYQRQTRVYIADLGSGEVKLQRFPEWERKLRAEPWAPRLHPNGKYYWSTPDWTYWQKGGMQRIFVYDPAKNRVDLVKSFPGLGGERSEALVLGPDGKLYGAGTYLNPADKENNTRTVSGYSYDPATGEVKIYPNLGPRHTKAGSYAYSYGVDDQYLYIASGTIPWWLLAVNLKSGEAKVLADAAEGEWRHRIHVWNMYPGARVHVQKSDADEKKEYWLWHGEMIPIIDRNNPPWKPRAAPGAGVRPVQIHGQFDPDENGNAMLWYRYKDEIPPVPQGVKNPTPEQLGWKKLLYTGVEKHPLSIHRLVNLGDGLLWGTAMGYAGRFLYDTKNGKMTQLGRGGSSIYATVPHDGKLYLSGYPSGPLYVYDPAKPWIFEKSYPPGPPTLKPDDPVNNMRLLGDFNKESRVKKMLSATVASDGKIYFGGEGLRDYHGGSLGWYDPQSGAIGGEWKPFENDPIHWVTPSNDRSKIIISTRANQGSGKVFVWDVASRQVERSIVPVEDAPKAGPLVEVSPGRMLGITDDPNSANGSILYGLDVNKGAVLWRKSVPGRLGFEWQNGTARWVFLKGPDGNIYTFLDKRLVRIRPENAAVQVLGLLPAQGHAAFVGNDLYLAGAQNLRRIANVTVH